MKSSQRDLLIAFSFLCIFILACGGSFSQTTADSQPTITSTQPEPTQVPTPSPIPTETPLPTATLEPTITPEITDKSATRDTLVSPPPADAGACANVLYPLIPGNEWVYQITSPDETSQLGLTVTAIEGNTATVNALYLDSGVTSETSIECDDGAILNFPIVLLGFLFGDANGNLKIDYVDGIFAPRYSDLETARWDLSWSGEYLASGEISANVDDESFTGRLENSPLTMNWQTSVADGGIFDPIEVIAGDFPQAIKVQREMIFNISAELEDEGAVTTLEAILTLETNLWFEPNLGLLRQEVESAHLNIYGVDFPVVMESAIELVEFGTNNN